MGFFVVKYGNIIHMFFHDIEKKWCSILDCMEVFSKGIHRAMVPVDSQMANISGVELMESASSYRMLTQMDLLKFLKQHDSELKPITSTPINVLGAVTHDVYAITDRTTLLEAIKCMRTAMLNAVPIVRSSESPEEHHSQLVNASLQSHYFNVYSSLYV